MLRPAQGVVAITLLFLVGCSNANVATQANASSSVATPTTTAIDAATAPQMDTTIVPGERVGAITHNTSRQNLVDWFGEANLRDEAIPVGEGETLPGTVVNLGERSLSVVWADETQSQVYAVRDLGSAWRTPEGIGVGTTLAELQTQLGTFQLYGLAWDYSGTVQFDGSSLDHYKERLVVRMSPVPDAHATHAEDYQAVIGDRLLDSTDPHWRSLGLTVNEVIVYLAPVQ